MMRVSGLGYMRLHTLLAIFRRVSHFKRVVRVPSTYNCSKMITFANDLPPTTRGSTCSTRRRHGACQSLPELVQRLIYPAKS